MLIVNIWNILAIPPTVNTIEIKRAYAKKLRLVNPEEDIEGFQRLRESYEQALQEAKYLKETETQSLSVPVVTASVVEPSVPTQPPTLPRQQNESSVLSVQSLSAIELAARFMTQFDILYQDITKRKDIEQWKRLFDHESLLRLDAKAILHNRLLDYITDHCHFPREVWQLFDEHFYWSEQELTLSQSYPDDFVSFILEQIHRSWSLRYNDFIEHLDIDYDFYLGRRDLAAQALMHNDLEYAGHYLSEASNLYNHDSDLLRMIGIYYMRTEQQQLAYEAFQSLLEVNPSDIDGRLYRAGLRLKQGDITGALQDYQYVLAHHPNDLQSLSGLAACYIAFNQLHEAKSIYESILELYPHDIEVRLRLMALCDQLADQLLAQLEKSPSNSQLYFTLAELYYELESYEECDRFLSKMTSFSAPQSDICLLQGKSLMKQEAYEEAIVCFDKAMKLSEQESKNGYEIWIQRGTAYIYAEHYDLAVADLSKALELDRNNTEVLYHLGNIYRAQQQYHPSIELLDRAIIWNPDHWRYYWARGLSLFALGKYKRALQDMIKLLEYNYTDATAWFRKAYCHLKLMEFEDAIESFTNSLQWSTNEYAHLVDYHIAVAHFMLGQYDEALKLATQFRSKSEEAPTYVLLGDIYRALGEDEKALEMYVEGSQKHPHQYTFHEMAVYILEGTGRELQLINHLDHILSEYPRNELALLQISRAYIDIGEWSKALTYLNIYHQQIPEPISNSYHLLYLGVVFYQLRQYNEAIPYLTEAVSNHVHADASSYLSMVYYELGQHELAVRYGQLALQQDPEHVDYVQRLTAIDQHLPKKSWFGRLRGKPSSHLWSFVLPLARHEKAKAADIHFTFGEDQDE